MSAVNAVLGVLTNFDPGRGGIGKRVVWDRAKITGQYELGEVLWRHFLVLHILIDGGTHVVKVFSENSFIAGTLLAGTSCNKEQKEYYDRVAQS